MFEPTGEVKGREQAYRDGDWIGTFNLWAVSREPEQSIVYQQRSPKSTWAPNLLDVTAGGHYESGEKLADGLREAEEELGKHYTPDKLIPLGKKLYVGANTNDTRKQNVIDIFLIEDNTPLDSYALQEDEVYALCKCPVKELLKAHRDPSYSFTIKARTAKGEMIDLAINKESFPQNYDNYHYKIAILADRYFKGDKDLLY